MRQGERRVSLAIECSARVGSVAIGVGAVADGVLPAAGSDPRQPRKGAELMPAIDALFRSRGLRPAELGRVLVSIGPGSFTGLRVAIATAKLLSETLGCELVAVPTLDALACNVRRPGAWVLAALNLKGSTVYAGCFQIDADGLAVPLAPVGLTTLPELLERCPRPLVVLGDPLPAPEGGWPEGVEHLSGAESTPQAEAVYRWGVARGVPIEPDALLPLYARPPEAEELWNRRHSESAARP